MAISRFNRFIFAKTAWFSDSTRKYARAVESTFCLLACCALSSIGAFADEPAQIGARTGAATLGSVDVESGVPASLSDDSAFPSVGESFSSTFQTLAEPTEANSTPNSESFGDAGQKTPLEREGDGNNFDLSSFGEEDNSSVSETPISGDKAPTSFLTDGTKALLAPTGISTSLKAILIMSLFTVAPGVLLMTTSYVRISIVYSILRQALGLGQIPSNQVVATLSVFLTILIMFPVWSTIYGESIEPYSKGEISGKAALEIGQKPLRDFLWKQIEKSGNTDSITIFARYVPEVATAKTADETPWRALAPAFLLSELKTAFLIGFQIFLPFLIIDVVVSCVLVSAGMMMLPPVVVSAPFKLILFVLVDGWTLTTGSLLSSFA